MVCASFFAGVGGIDLGFSLAGFPTIFANEFDADAAKTYRANHADTKLAECDIRTLDPKTDIPDFDIMLAGFPCQAFSIAGYRQGFADAKGRGNLFFDLMRIIRVKRPAVVFLENVKNLLSHDNGNTFKTIRGLLEAEGYTVKYKVLNACQYGNIPQNRERIYIVCFRDASAAERFSFPEEIPLDNILTKAIDFDAQVPASYYYGSGRKMYPELVSSMTRSDTCYQWRRVYVRENKSGLCPTLTANMGTGGNNVPLIRTSDGRYRKLTPRECFSLQGFADTFVLPAGMKDSPLYKQAGNSVVVPVIQRIALAIADAL